MWFIEFGMCGCGGDGEGGGGLLVECGDGSGSRSGRQRILLLHFSRENRREIILRREIKMSCVKK